MRKDTQFDIRIVTNTSLRFSAQLGINSFSDDCFFV